MTRFQRLALATLVTTLALVTIGVIVRATDSGLGCPDWPLCHGQLIPAARRRARPGSSGSTGRVAVVVGFEILGLAILALRDYRDRRSILWPTLAAVGLVGFQAWLGRETVRLGNSGESVTAHLATAMSLVGLLVYVTVRAGYPARIGGRGASQRFTLLAAFGAVATFALLLFGSHVTATDSALDLPGLAADGRHARPAGHRRHLGPRPAPLGRRRSSASIVVAVAVVAWRTQRDHPVLVRLSLWAAALYLVQVVVGGAQVLTRLAAWTQTLHLALGAIIWALMAGLAVTATTRRGSAPARRRARTRGRRADATTAADAGDRPRATRSAPTSR